jgi:hypothetical protein
MEQVINEQLQHQRQASNMFLGQLHIIPTGINRKKCPPGSQNLRLTVYYHKTSCLDGENILLGKNFANMM